MSDDGRPDVTLRTLHEDLGEVKADLREVKADLGEVKADLREVKADLREVKADLREAKADVREVKADVRDVKADLREVKSLVAAGFRAFPPDWPGEMLRTLRENAHLLGENNRLIREGNRLSEERFARLDVTLREQAIETQTALRAVADGQRQLSADVGALVVRIDALIRGRGDGAPPA
jgi:chromosome segregation ATPase